MRESNKKPEIVVFAGPNGSGKSTLTKALRPTDMTYINADDIQFALGCDTKEAAVLAEQRREDCIAKQQDFCFETVLSTDRNLNLLRKAKEKGYFIRCYFVLTADPTINIARVQSRVFAGGHDVPVDKIESRYVKSLANVREIVEISDVCHIYDNSTGPYRIFKKRKAECWYCPEKYLWGKADIVALTGIENAAKAPLNIKK